MHKQKVTIKHYISDTPYCETCRFCKVVRAGQQTCLLTNEILQRDAYGILKTRECLAWNKREVEDSEPTGKLTRSVMSSMLSGYDKIVKFYMKQGYPETIARKEAKKDLTEDCD